MLKKKQKLIRKHKTTKNESPSSNELSEPVECFQEGEEDSKSMDEQSEEMQLSKQKKDFVPLRSISVSFKGIEQLGAVEREKLKAEHPSIAEYIFMSQREKCKFFHEKNLTYRKKVQTPGNIQARTIGFKRTYEVLLFGQEDPPEKVKDTKTFKDKYDKKIHYS